MPGGGWMDGFVLQIAAKSVAAAVSLWDQLQRPGPCSIAVRRSCFSSLSLPTRCDSWSNSDRSLEQTSFDDVFVDGLQPLPYINLVHPSAQRNGSQEAPPARAQAALTWSREVNGPARDRFSSPLLETSFNPALQVEKNQRSFPYGLKELDILSNTPPPRPPKPIHLSERRQEEQLLWSGHGSIRKPECTAAPRRISLSGLDNVRTWKGKCWMQILKHGEKAGSSF